MAVTIAFFGGVWKPFSNFYDAVVKWKGPSGRVFVFPRTENGYQAFKSLNDDDWMPFAIGYYDTEEGIYHKCEQAPYWAVAAKKAGKKLNIRPDWELVDVQFMLDLNRQKYDHPAFKKLLLSSKDAIIQEGNYWHDTRWGICNGKCFKGPHKPEGKNFLGLVLMQVRDEKNAEVGKKKDGESDEQ